MRLKMGDTTRDPRAGQVDLIITSPLAPEAFAQFVRDDAKEKRRIVKQPGASIEWTDRIAALST